MSFVYMTRHVTSSMCRTPATIQVPCLHLWAPAVSLALLLRCHCGWVCVRKSNDGRLTRRFGISRTTRGRDISCNLRQV